MFLRFISEKILKIRLAEFFDCEYALENSKRLAFWYKLVAEQFDCEFFDAATVAEAGKVDSLHLSAEGHKKLAEALADIVK